MPPKRTARGRPLPVSRLPKIRQLREELEYGDRALARYKEFQDCVADFRHRHVCKDGRKRNDLRHWTSDRDQTALTDMAYAFLVTEGYGRKFWPDEAADEHYNPIKYSEDALL